MYNKDVSTTARYVRRELSLILPQLDVCVEHRQLHGLPDNNQI